MKNEQNIRIEKKLSQLFHEDTIQIRLHSGEDLYNHFDPAPEQERELSQEIESYILKELEYKSAKTRIAVTFITDDASLYDIEIMRRAFANHFTRRVDEQIIKNRKSIGLWIHKLFIGIFVLAAFLFLAHFFSIHTKTHPFYSILSEGFGIVGWVAIWEPATYFLYGRSEEKRELFNLIRLMHATVTIKNKI